MKRLISLIALVLILALNVSFSAPAAAATARPGAAPISTAAPKAIPDHYIVVLKDGADPRAVAAISGITPAHVYTAALNGFAAQLNQGQLNALQHHPGVAYIAQDQEVQLDATQVMDAAGQPWGLDRIDQHQLPLSKTYTYNHTGSTVNAYIIDTGIQTNHPEFRLCFPLPNGTKVCFWRAQVGYDALGGNGQDCQGHGTHVAGTVGGNTYGVAKAVQLYAVRVLDCTGHGSASAIISGIDWVKLHAKHPAVANMSFGTLQGTYAPLDTAVQNLSNSGVFVVVAAGNITADSPNPDACTISPAHVAILYTVAAADKTDTRAAFSKKGTCVDAYAPGVGIKSAWLNSGTATKDGTSMAAPHVTGVAALYKNVYGDASQSTINDWLNKNATLNVIKSNPTGTPNRLLYKAGL
jgi:subtilisin family serine protease